MPKRLTEEEKQQRAWAKDDEILYVVQCKCNRIHEIVIKEKLRICPCKNRVIINNYKANLRNCKVLYERGEAK